MREESDVWIRTQRLDTRIHDRRTDKERYGVRGDERSPELRRISKLCFASCLPFLPFVISCGIDLCTTIGIFQQASILASFGDMIGWIGVYGWPTDWILWIRLGIVHYVMCECYNHLQRYCDRVHSVQ